MFLEAHIAHAVTAHFSNSCWLSLLRVCRNKRKKLLTTLLHFWVRPLNRAHTFWAKGHSHKMWCIVSVLWRQNSHRVSTFTRRWCSLSLVGRQFETALHRNILTFGGTFRSHTLFQVGPSSRAPECSAQLYLLERRATRYAVFTENFWAEFSIHTSVSWDCRWSSGIDRISSLDFPSWRSCLENIEPCRPCKIVSWCHGLVSMPAWKALPS